MTAKLTFIKGQLRLNKLASGDYDNIEAWKWCEAYNSFQVLYSRFRLKQAEKEKTDIDDLNFLLTTKEYKTTARGNFVETVGKWPEDYLSWNKLRIEAKKGNCTKTAFKLYFIEEANSEFYLTDPNKKPSFEWAETIYSLVGNKVKVYTNKEFSIPSLQISYYRKPKDIIIEGIEDENGKLLSINRDPEFVDDICEILIRGACAIISGDIEYLNKFNISNQEIKTFS